MDFTALLPACPEIILLLLTVGILVADMLLPRERQALVWWFSLAAVAVCACAGLFLFSADETTYAFGRAFVSDPASCLLRLFACLALFVTLLYIRRYVDASGMTGGFIGSEFYVLVLFSLLGQMIVISGLNLLVIYLGVELMSLPLYALVAMRRHDTRVSEAAVKYFILGMLGSGFLLYGISMLYGATGTLNIPEMAQACSFGNINRSVLVFGVVFAVCGLAFKLGVAPFHMWVPDVYEGAPTAVTLLIGGVPKLAAFALCLRVLAGGLFPLAHEWQQMLIIISVLSMTIGNITALMQDNIKRMLAYSAIGQMGFMLLGFLPGAPGEKTVGMAADAYSSALFYTFVYVLAVLGAFGITLMLSRAGYEAEKLDDFRGLNRKNPWYALVMMAFMLSLAGIPPLAGFYAKLSVLQTVIASGRIWLAVVAIVLSVVGAFYYLRIVRLMYFDDPVTTEKIVAPKKETLTLALNMAAVVLLGIFPGFLMSLCHHAIVKSLAL